MKPSAMITMAVMLAGNAWAATNSDSQSLVVCTEDGNHAGVSSAEAKASSMFLSAGVKLEWHGEAKFCKGNPDAMVVSFNDEGGADVAWTAPVWLEPSGTLAPVTGSMAATDEQFVASNNRPIYHLATCRDAKNISPQNLVRGAEAKRGRTLHDGCPR